MDQTRTRGKSTIDTKKYMDSNFNVSLPNGMIANLYGPFGKLNMFAFASEFNAKTHHVQDLFLGKHSCVRKVFQTLC